MNRNDIKNKNEKSDIFIYYLPQLFLLNNVNLQ